DREKLARLEASATPTLKMDFANAANRAGEVDALKIANGLAHSFCDPVIKASMAIDFAGGASLTEDKNPRPVEALPADRRRLVFEAACRFRALVEDIVYNYSR